MAKQDIHRTTTPVILLFKYTATAMLLTHGLMGSAFAQNLGPADPSTVVDPETIAWDDEHDLIVLLSDSSNRVAIANAIVQVSSSSGTLSNEQRYDGLRMAGTSLFHDGEFSSAVAALELAAAYTSSNYDKAEVLAAAAEAHLRGTDDRAATIQKFKTAVDLYKQSDPAEASPFALEGAFRQLVNLAAQEGDFESSLQAALDAIALSGTLTAGNLDLGFYKYSGARAAQELGNNLQARTLYTQFLAEFPEYLNQQYRLGVVPHAKIQLAIVNGSSWEHPDEALIEAVLEVLRNPDYFLMPVRANYAEKLARSFDKVRAREAAAALRSELAKTTMNVIEDLDPNDRNEQSLGKWLWREVAISQLNGAISLFYEQRDPAAALEFVERIKTPSDFADPRIVSDAATLETEITRTP